MEVLGFSINTLTLFGMILSVGLVVDDAIVVVENVERHIENGLSPKDAAKKAMEEVTGPVIAIVLVLCSVFVPVAFLGGITGQLYKQFAITIAISVTISGFVALTLSPALCSLILKPRQEGKRKGFFGLFNRFFDRARDGYGSMAARVIRRWVIALGVFGIVVVLAVGMFKVIPHGFLPEEDQGYFITVVQLPDGASKQRTVAVLNKLEDYYGTIPAIYGTQALVGQNFVFGTRGPNAATVFTPLKHWDERKKPQEQVKALVGSPYKEFAKVPEALTLALNAPSIRGLGARGGFSVELQDPGGGDFKKFASVAQEFVAEAKKDPAVGAIGSSLRIAAPRIYANINRDRAKALGVPISDVFDTLQAYFGNLYINDFIKFGRVYRVQTEAQSQFRSSPDDISKIYVRAQGTRMIPLNTVAKVRTAPVP
jgi:HAE1 family hydrophobic/amphiphilic exporter-1/multidrug efflux pump